MRRLLLLAVLFVLAVPLFASVSLTTGTTFKGVGTFTSGEREVQSRDIFMASALVTFMDPLYVGVSASSGCIIFEDNRAIDLLSLRLHAGLTVDENPSFRLDAFYGLRLLEYNGIWSPAQCFGLGMYFGMKIQGLDFRIGGEMSWTPTRGRASYMLEMFAPSVSVGRTF